MAHDGATIVRRRAFRVSTIPLNRAQQFPVSLTRQEITVVESRVFTHTHTHSHFRYSRTFGACYLSPRIYWHTQDLNRRQTTGTKSGGGVVDLDWICPSGARHSKPLVGNKKKKLSLSQNSLFAVIRLYHHQTHTTDQVAHWPSSSLTTFPGWKYFFSFLPRVHESATFSILL